MSPSTPFCPLSNRPETGLGARFSVSLNLNKIRVRQPSSTLIFFGAIGGRAYPSKFLPRKYICIAWIHTPRFMGFFAHPPQRNSLLASCNQMREDWRPIGA
jgi:hypothetical protein